MTHRHQLHAVGTFPICPDCGDEYRHIVDDRANDGGHFISCCCGDSPKSATFDALLDAMHVWCDARGVVMPDSVAVHRVCDSWPMLMAAGETR